MMTIFRIAVDKVVPWVNEHGAYELKHVQVLAVRLAAESQEEAEHRGHLLWTTWMRQNPGVPSMMRTSWPNSLELGEKVNLTSMHQA